MATITTKNSGRGSETPVDQVEGGPERGPEGETIGPGEGKQGSAREPDRRDQQPGGGKHSESEKPDSPDSRWGSGKDQR